MSEIIYFDMDGVIADFFSAAFQVLNERLRPKYDPLHLDSYYQRGLDGDNLYPLKTFGITKEEFKEIIASEPNFWNRVKPLPLINYAKFLASTGRRVAILTDPGRNKEKIQGKAEWLSYHFKDFPEINFHFTDRKESFAAEESFLVDDFLVNCVRFMLAGGEVLLIHTIRTHSKESVNRSALKVMETLNRLLAPL